MNRDSLGGFNAIGNKVVQEVVDALNTSGSEGGIRGVPAYWNGLLYVVGVNDRMKAFAFSNGLLSTTPLAEGPETYFYPGATPTVSAHGSAGGIIWALKTDSYAKGGPAILAAYDAVNVGMELYSSRLLYTRDHAGGAVKFAVPTVANGKVDVGTQAELDVYGLLP